MPNNLLRVIQLVSEPGLKAKIVWLCVLDWYTITSPREGFTDKEPVAPRAEVVLDSNASRRLQSLGLTCCVMLPPPRMWGSISYPYTSHRKSPRSTSDNGTPLGQLVAWHRCKPVNPGIAPEAWRGMREEGPVII